MRITMLAASVGNPFGQERVLALSTQALRAGGHLVEVIADHVHTAVPLVASTHQISGLSSLQPLSKKRTVTEILQSLTYRLEQFQPDVVHFLDFVDDRVLTSAAAVAPCVLTAHTVAPTCPASTRQSRRIAACPRSSGYGCLIGHHQHGCLNYLKSDLHRLHAIYGFVRRKKFFKKHLKKIAAISSYVESCLLNDGWPAEQVVRVPNPVPVPETVDMSRKRRGQILVCSRLTNLKGVDVLLKAAALIVDQEFQMTICGEGPERQPLLALSERLGLASRIRWMGQQSFESVSKQMELADIFVQANRGPEAFGMGVAEAMAWGCAPIVSKVPALNSLVEDGKTGLVFEKESEASLAAAISKLVTHPTLARDLGRAAHEHAKAHFSIDSHLKATLSLYR
jgi:glycosyltransferase involved in cell wall biosynthesis